MEAVIQMLDAWGETSCRQTVNDQLRELPQKLAIDESLLGALWIVVWDELHRVIMAQTAHDLSNLDKYADEFDSEAGDS